MMRDHTAHTSRSAHPTGIKGAGIRYGTIAHATNAPARLKPCLVRMCLADMTVGARAKVRPGRFCRPAWPHHLFDPAMRRF